MSPLWQSCAHSAVQYVTNTQRQTQHSVTQYKYKHKHKNIEGKVTIVRILRAERCPVSHSIVMFVQVVVAQSSPEECEHNFSISYLHLHVICISPHSKFPPLWLRYESSTLILYKELSSSIFQSLSVRHPWHLSRSPLCAIYKGINALY